MTNLFWLQPSVEPRFFSHKISRFPTAAPVIPQLISPQNQQFEQLWFSATVLMVSPDFWFQVSNHK